MLNSSLEFINLILRHHVATALWRTEMFVLFAGREAARNKVGEKE
jgi:hypothetical protein